MKLVATIEARMTSTRLPGKVLMPVLGRPMLEFMVERVKRVPEIDQIVIATTVNDTDQPIVDLAGRLGVGCFRGSERDVLGRVLLAAQAYEADIITELTGDCPLIDPEVISLIINRFHTEDADYVSNVPKRTYPIGMETQVFPTRVLSEVAARTNDPLDREHVSRYIYHHTDSYRIVTVESGLPEQWHGFGLTLDTPEDYDLIRQVFEELYPSNPEFKLGDILGCLEGRPELRPSGTTTNGSPASA